jgi:hypothetical protein
VKGGKAKGITQRGLSFVDAFWNLTDNCNSVKVTQYGAPHAVPSSRYV